MGDWREPGINKITSGITGYPHLTKAHSACTEWDKAFIRWDTAFNQVMPLVASISFGVIMKAPIFFEPEKRVFVENRILDIVLVVVYMLVVLMFVMAIFLPASMYVT